MAKAFRALPMSVRDEPVWRAQFCVRAIFSLWHRLGRKTGSPFCVQCSDAAA